MDRFAVSSYTPITNFKYGLLYFIFDPPYRVNAELNLPLTSMRTYAASPKLIYASATEMCVEFLPGITQ